MRRAEIIDALTVKADELGVRFSSRMLRDWSDEGLVEPAIRVPGTSNEWSYSEDTVTRGSLILELKREHVVRSALLRIYLWLSGCVFDADVLVESLTDEMRRTLHRVRRVEVLPCDVRRGGEPNAWEWRRLQPQNQKLDKVFQALGIAYPAEFMRDIASSIYWGAPERKSDLDFVVSIFASLLGDPDEIHASTISRMAEVSDEDLGVARHIFLGVLTANIIASACAKGFISAEIGGKIGSAFDKITRSLVSPQWLVIALTFIAVNVSQFRKLNNDSQSGSSGR